MPIEVLVEQAYTLEKKLESAENRLNNLKQQAKIGEVKPTYKEMFAAKKEVRTLTDSLTKVQNSIDQAHLNREKGGIDY